MNFESQIENIDTMTATGRLMFQLCGAFAEFERNLIIERTTPGLPQLERWEMSGAGREYSSDHRRNDRDRELIIRTELRGQFQVLTFSQGRRVDKLNAGDEAISDRNSY